MTSLKTLYFPWTTISSFRQYPLFSLFPILHLLQPVESGEKEREDFDSFINSDFCQVHTPYPLLEDRDRFLRLLKDIETRKDDYAAQLSGLTLAAMSSNSQDTQKGRSSLISEILTPKEVREDEEKLAQEEKLWRARLVLAIAEILDREEEEVAVAMAILEQEEEDLYAALQGEDDNGGAENLFAELNRFESKLGAENRQKFIYRYTNWRVLFNRSSFGADTLLVTNSSDVADQLIQAYEKKTGEEPVILPGPNIPEIINLNKQEAIQDIKNFHHNNHHLIQEMLKMWSDFYTLSIIKTIQEVPPPTYKNLCNNWNTAIEQAFPAGRFGQSNTKFHIFPQLPCTVLTGREDRSPGKENGLLLLVE